MIQLVLCLSLGMILTGCAMMGAPGSVSVANSDYDQSKEVYLKPGWANSGFIGSLKIGARKSSKMSAKDAVLIVRNDQIKNFSFETPNFFIKLNGIELKFNPISKKTECEIGSQSDVAHCTQEYAVDMALLEKMASSTDVKFKLDLDGNSYVEGSLANSGMTTAKSGLADFISRANKEFGTTTEVRKPSSF